MTHNFDELINKNGGINHFKDLIENEGVSLVEVQKVLLGRHNASHNKKILKILGIDQIPFPKVSSKSRKWMIYWTKYGDNYWDNLYLVEETLTKLNNPIINHTKSCSRYVITMWGHPSSNKDSHQVKAHQVVWELDNECFLPEGYEVYPLDGDFLNLSVDNFNIRTKQERKSFYAMGERNYFYVGGPTKYNNYSRGWNRISKEYKNKVNNKCEVCGSLEKLNTHHLISYWLFDEKDMRVHSDNNLFCVCDSCHGKIHRAGLLIQPHISVTKYTKLLELLESLKSQVPDTLKETLKDVEKQLGLTDNQQPST